MTGTTRGETGPIRPLPPEAYRRMSQVLRAGLVVSLGMLAVGLAVEIALHSGQPISEIVSSNPILQYLNLPGLAAGLASGSLSAYLTLGLLVLVATPLLRVASGFYYFATGGERWMAGITLTVLVLLLLGILVLGPLIR